MTAPHGLPAIIRTFGNPLEHLEHKAVWEHTALDFRVLPTALPYAYGDVLVKTIRGHKRIVDVVVAALMECLANGVAPDRIAYGGMYSFRAKRSSPKLSTHAWGIAIDLDPARNPMGKPWDGGAAMMPAAAVKAFEERGFVWGGRWDQPDCMHFQMAAGY